MCGAAGQRDASGGGVQGRDCRYEAGTRQPKTSLALPPSRPPARTILLVMQSLNIQLTFQPLVSLSEPQRPSAEPQSRRGEARRRGRLREAVWAAVLVSGRDGGAENVLSL